ncbi:hypothetical protein KCP71_22915 [Salmonella enterica subsp. enterica]|nr:hypothetical protein KCP71_22915 [Salmonella enterica subsp. enterica]
MAIGWAGDKFVQAANRARKRRKMASISLLDPQRGQWRFDVFAICLLTPKIKTRPTSS